MWEKFNRNNHDPEVVAFFINNPNAIWRTHPTATEVDREQVLWLTGEPSLELVKIMNAKNKPKANFTPTDQ